jgi:hypothetical protein
LLAATTLGLALIFQVPVLLAGASRQLQARRNPFT